jgi:hypothetical protein
MKGLIAYLGKKVIEDKTCIHCGAEEFKCVEGLKKHMIDK